MNRKLQIWAEAVTGAPIRPDGIPDRAPCWSQPVGWDGQSIHLVAGEGDVDERVLHEVCHFLVTPPERRRVPNWGLGPGPRLVDTKTADNEEVTAALLTARLAPRFGVRASALPRPDESVTVARNVDWDACEARADALLRAAGDGAERGDPADR